MVPLNLFSTLSLTKSNQTTTRHTPHLGEVMEIELVGLKVREIELAKMKAREIEPAGMKVREIDVVGPEVEEIEAEAKDTVPTTDAQTQIGRLSTIGDFLETLLTVRDIQMNTLAMRGKHRCQVWGVNPSMILDTTSRLGEFNHLLGWPSPH